MLLTNRDLKTDAFQNNGEVTVIERADAPTAKQVAVIWVQEDGLAPQVNGSYTYLYQSTFFLGFWVCDKKGKMRELKSGNPQLDPCCFPLLHPRGTLGYRWFIKKRCMGLGPTHREELEMQTRLNEAIARDLEDERDGDEEEIREEDIPMLAAQFQEHIDDIENAEVNRFEDAVEEELNNQASLIHSFFNLAFRIL